MKFKNKITGSTVDIKITYDEYKIIINTFIYEVIFSDKEIEQIKAYDARKEIEAIRDIFYSR